MPSFGPERTGELWHNVAEVSGYMEGPDPPPDGAAGVMLKEQVVRGRCVLTKARISLSWAEVPQRQEQGCADVEQERLEEDLGQEV